LTKAAEEALPNGPVYLSGSTFPSPYSNQGLTTPRTGSDWAPSLRTKGSGTTRNILPPFIEGGYKVKSKETGVASDDLIFTSQKYILDVKKHLASTVVVFTEDSKGPGGNYQAWRQTFSNAVGEYRYINDFIMGELLRSRIA
jgi:hypothetical protein